MASHTETYEGCQIEIDGDRLTINGKSIAARHVGGKWSCEYLPYSNHDSLIDLARETVSHGGFRRKNDK